MNRIDMEDTLKIRSWGAWARKTDIDLEFKTPGWAKLVKMGYRESPKNPIPQITDDVALAIDKMLLSLDEDLRDIVQLIYQYRTSIREAADFKGVGKSTAARMRDEALSVMIGMLPQARKL